MGDNRNISEGELKLDDLLKTNIIDEKAALSIFAEAHKMIEAKAKAEGKSVSNYGADDYALEVEKLIKKILMASDLTNEDEYLRKLELAKEYVWPKSLLTEDDGCVDYKLITIQSMLTNCLPVVRQEQQQQRALQACEKAKAELLSEIKENMRINDHIYYAYYFNPTSSFHSYGIEALMLNYKSHPDNYENKSYKDALGAYGALDDMSKILERTGKDKGDFTPKRNLDDFNKCLQKNSSILEKNRDSTATKVGKIVLGFLLALTVIGIPAAYMLTKTKGERLTEELKEVTKPPRPR